MNARPVSFLFCIFVIVSCTHPQKTETPLSLSGIEMEDSAPQDAQARSLREQGIAAFQKNDYPKAISQLEAAFLISPDANDAKSRYLLFYCYLSTGDYKKALTLAEQLAKLYPYQPIVYQQVGLAQLWSGQTTAAITSFRRAAEFDSHSPKLHFYLGMAYQMIKQEPAKLRSFQKAEKEYLQILEKNPNDFSANFELASLYLYWNEQIEKVPELLTLAKLSIGTNQSEADIDEERNIIERFYFPLSEAVLLFRKRNPKASISLLYQAFNNAPSGIRADLAEVYFYLGLNHELLKEAETATLFFEQSAALDPKGPFASDHVKYRFLTDANLR